MQSISDIHDPDCTSYQFVLEKTEDNAAELANFLVNFRKSGKDWLIVSDVTEDTEQLMNEITDILSSELDGMEAGERIFFRIKVCGSELSLHIERSNTKTPTRSRNILLRA